jgi:short-subunit dehydrogenase
MLQSFEIQMFKKVHGHSEVFLQHFSEALWKKNTENPLNCVTRIPETTTAGCSKSIFTL